MTAPNATTSNVAKSETETSSEDFYMQEEVMGNENTLDAGKHNQRIYNTTLRPENDTTVSEPVQAATADVPAQDSDKVPIDGGGIPPVTARYERQFPENLEPWDKPVDITEVADQMDMVIQKHCVLTQLERWSIVLWVLSSYMIDSFRVFPRLAIISPIKRCGKTTTLEVVGSMCGEALLVANLSQATLYRIAAKTRPTLIIDEADTFIKGGDPALIGLINSGQTRSTAKVLRCQGDDFETKAHSTWLPMVLASIGGLAPTIMDRSIVVNLRRKKPEEAVEMLPANIDELHIGLRRKVIRWCLDVRDKLTANILRPDNIGNDRAADNWTALFTVARLINPLWLDRCQQAYRGLTQADEPELPAVLLADIKQIVGRRSTDRIKTSELLSELLSDPEKPWCNIDGKGRMTARMLAAMLKPFSIASKSIRFDPSDTGTHRGYYVEQFKDAFERYVIHQEPIKPYI